MKQPLTQIVLRHERAVGGPGEDQDVEPARVIGYEKRVRAQRLAFGSYSGSADSRGGREEPPGPSRTAEQCFGDDVDRADHGEEAEQTGNAQRCAKVHASSAPLMITVEGDAVKLHAVVDEAEAELLGDPLLQGLELVIDELNDVARFDVDKVVVMTFRRRLIAGAAIAELVALEDARFLEQPHRPVDRRD